MNTQTNRLWDDPARDYRRRYRLPDQFTWDVAAWPRIDFDGYTALAFDLLPPPPGRVLDVGCGPGAGSLRLSGRGYDVVGVDYNERAVAFARILAEGGTFVQGDVRALGAIDDPAVDDGFDAAVCIEVLEHVPPEFRSRVFEGVLERLRPGGTFVLTTPAPQMSANAWDYDRPTRDDLVGMLVDTGFESVEVRFQHRLWTVFDPRVWRLFSNRWIDVRIARQLVRRLFLSRWNRVSVPERAGRFIVSARRP